MKTFTVISHMTDFLHIRNYLMSYAQECLSLIYEVRHLSVKAPNGFTRLNAWWLRCLLSIISINRVALFKIYTAVREEVFWMNLVNQINEKFWVKFSLWKYDSCFKSYFFVFQVVTFLVLFLFLKVAGGENSLNLLNNRPFLQSLQFY